MDDHPSIVRTVAMSAPIVVVDIRTAQRDSRIATRDVAGASAFAGQPVSATRRASSVASVSRRLLRQIWRYRAPRCRWYESIVSRILIAEDSERLARFVEKGLGAAGHATTVARDGMEAAAIARDEDFDLLILDIGLPGQDGFAVLRQLRTRGEHLPVLVLTARHLVEDVIAALDEGADDYLTKPFIFDELLARVRARLRTNAAAATTMVAGGLKLDLASRSVALEGRNVLLTTTELRVLEVFMRRPGEALSREDLLSHVWGFRSDVGSNVVDVYVSYLRRKLGAERFETVRGYGYRMLR